MSTLTPTPLKSRRSLAAILILRPRDLSGTWRDIEIRYQESIWSSVKTSGTHWICRTGLHFSTIVNRNSNRDQSIRSHRTTPTQMTRMVRGATEVRIDFEINSGRWAISIMSVTTRPTFSHRISGMSGQRGPHGCIMPIGALTAGERPHGVSNVISKRQIFQARTPRRDRVTSTIKPISVSRVTRRSGTQGQMCQDSRAIRLGRWTAGTSSMSEPDRIRSKRTRWKRTIASSGPRTWALSRAQGIPLTVLLPETFSAYIQKATVTTTSS